MSVIPIDWDVVRSAADRASKDVARLLRSASDASAAVPNLTWNVGELGAHLVTTVRGYIGFADGDPSGMDGRTMAEINEERLRAYRSRDLAEMASDLERGTDEFLSAIGADDSRMSMSEVPIDRSTAAAIWLGELRLHELDLSRAMGRRWSMSRDEALMVTYAALNVVPRFVDPDAARGFRATYELRFRGGETVTMVFDNGALTIARGRAPRADCRMSLDPLSSLLVGYGRASQWRAAFAGKAIAWGRRPWLVLRFNKLIPYV